MKKIEEKIRELTKGCQDNCPVFPCEYFYRDMAKLYEDESKAYLTELIGEDEKDKYGRNGHWREARNALRAELRKKLSGDQK